MNNIRVSHIDHCTVLITSVEKAREFYGGLLGLREIPAPRTFDFIALWYDLGSCYLHLLLKEQPDSRSPRHFCLHVANVEACREYFRARQIPFEETVAIPGADRIFIHDPDHNRLELLHWHVPYQPEIEGAYKV